MTRLLLVGCVKSKASRIDHARYLYQGQLWTLRRQYAESSGLPWAILSARHGVISPDCFIGPYDQTIEDTMRDDHLRLLWHSWVSVGIQRHFGLSQRNGEWPDDLVIEVHAGAPYVRALADALEHWPASLEHPVQGLQIGEQKRWYRERLPAP